MTKIQDRRSQHWEISEIQLLMLPVNARTVAKIGLLTVMISHGLNVLEGTTSARGSNGVYAGWR